MCFAVPSGPRLRHCLVESFLLVETAFLIAEFQYMHVVVKVSCEGADRTHQIATHQMEQSFRNCSLYCIVTVDI